MKQLTSLVTGRLPWVIRFRGRIVAALASGAVTAALTYGLPVEFNIQLTFDVAVVTYLALFSVLMCRASPEDAAEISRRGEPTGLPFLLVVIALSVMSLVGVTAMLNNSRADPTWMTNLHMATSLLAVFLAWLLSHVVFGLFYMRLYYDDTIVEGEIVYHEGLEYPERAVADYWDFMYYAFTIAMCYQTSDVSITSVRIRRVTLLHAIYSFIFVTAIIGLLVNIISNIA